MLQVIGRSFHIVYSSVSTGKRERENGRESDSYEWLCMTNEYEKKQMALYYYKSDRCPRPVIFKRRNHRRYDREVSSIFRAVTITSESLKDQDKYLHIHSTILIFYF